MKVSNINPSISVNGQSTSLLLAIDTCGPVGSVALGQMAGGELHILGETSLDGRRSAEILVGSVCELLTLAGVQLGQLHAMVAVSGPGSFTGVRVGLSAVKGLAEPRRIPVVAVSRLEVLAAKAGVADAALDAHRHEVFLRLGLPDGEARELLAGEAELAAVKPAHERIAVCDEAAALLLSEAWPATELVRVAAPVAADALLLCLPRVKAGEFVDLALLDGHYLRRSDAEIFGAEAAGEAAEESVSFEESVLVRPMCGMDLQEVTELAGSLKDAPQWPHSAYLTALDKDAAQRRIALVAQGPEPEFRLMGFAVASLLPPEAELETIAVGAEFQRRGVARKLFALLAYELRAAQIAEVLLEVRASNQAALALYRRLGFVETGCRPRYYQSPAEDAVLMRLRL